jgi:holdfast attachment protein HfaA
MYRAPYSWALAAASVAFFSNAAFAGDFDPRHSAAMTAQGFSNSAAFNGGFGGQGAENMPALGRIRDPKNNLLVVNGIIGGHAAAGAGASAVAAAGAGASFSQQEGVGQTSAGATAIGNNLSINVIGAWNTVIVDSTQINNGDQNAEVTLNGDLKL